MPPRDFRYWKLLLPSQKTTHLALVLAAVVGTSWLFLAYGQALLVEKVLWAMTGAAGLFSYQRLKTGHTQNGGSG